MLLKFIDDATLGAGMFGMPGFGMDHAAWVYAELIQEINGASFYKIVAGGKAMAQLFNVLPGVIGGISVRRTGAADQAGLNAYCTNAFAP